MIPKPKRAPVATRSAIGRYASLGRVTLGLPVIVQLVALLDACPRRSCSVLRLDT